MNFATAFISMAEGESIVLHYTPSQLVGQYFEVV